MMSLISNATRVLEEKVALNRFLKNILSLPKSLWAQASFSLIWKAPSMRGLGEETEECTTTEFNLELLSKKHDNQL